jgi:lipopolysaccharide export system permease protein
LLSSYISPLGQNKARSLLKNSSIDFLPSLIKEGKFIDTIKGLTIFIDYKNEEQKYFNIFLTEEKINGTKKIIYAESGYHDINNNDKKFRLINGKIIDQNEEKSIEFSFDEINFDLSKYQSKTITFPKIQETSSFKLLKCIIYNYKNKIQDYSETDFNCELSTIVVVQQEMLRRLHLPIYLPLLSLLCGLLVTKSKEYIYYNRFKYCLFSFIFSILVFSEISLKYSLINFSSFVFFITFPIIIFIIIYIIYSHEKKI